MAKVESRVVSDTGVLQGTVDILGTIDILVDSPTGLGTGTDFRKQVGAGNYIYIPSEQKAYKIISINNKHQVDYLEELWFEKAVTSAYSGVPKLINRYPTSTIVTNIGATSVIVNGTTFAAGESMMINLDSGTEPIMYDATGGSLRIELIFGY